MGVTLKLAVLSIVCPERATTHILDCRLAELGARLRRMALDDYVQALASYEPLWRKDDGA
jgi:hypothetical protein